MAIILDGTAGITADGVNIEPNAIATNSSGNVRVGANISSGYTAIRFTVNGVGTDGTTTSFRANDSSGQNLFYIGDDGQIVSSPSKTESPLNSVFATGTKLLGISTSGVFVTTDAYNTTTASAANAFVSTAGAIQRSTSSLKYKRDVQDYAGGLTQVLQLRPVTYKGTNPDDGDTTHAGLIAEEVGAVAGMEPFVVLAPDGTPDALAYGNMVAVLINAVKELAARVAVLEG